MNHKLLICIISLLIYINPAFAYQLNDIGTEQQYKQSDAVLIGTVIDIYIDKKPAIRVPLSRVN